MDVPVGKLRVSEDEQDLDWALNTGLIAPGEYKALLEDTGLMPTEIEFM